MQYLQNDTSVFIFQADSTYSDSLATSTYDSLSVQPEAYASLFTTEISKNEFADKPLITQEQPFWVDGQ